MVHMVHMCTCFKTLPLQRVHVSLYETFYYLLIPSFLYHL